MPLPTLRETDARDGLFAARHLVRRSPARPQREVMRCAYWDAPAGCDDIDRTYEVRINGLPEDGAGMDQVPGGQ